MDQVDLMEIYQLGKAGKLIPMPTKISTLSLVAWRYLHV